MKKFLSVLLLLFSVQQFALSEQALNPTYSKNNADPKNNVHTKTTILVFGDSLSSAYNISIENGWVSLLQDLIDKKKLDITLINASISGETTSGGLQRLKSQLNKHQPDIVILELGANDALRGFNLATTKNNLTQMIKMSHQHSSQVLLAGMRIPPNYGRTYTKQFEQIYLDLATGDLASEQSLVLIPFLLKSVAAQKQYLQTDGIHPNKKAQPFIMQTVWQYLAPILKL